MALFLIKRGVPGSDQGDIDAAVFRSMACVYQFPGMRWITSYWDQANGISYCVYEAASREQIEAHSARAQIPCDDVWEVSSVDPSQYIGSRAEATAAIPAS